MKSSKHIPLSFIVLLLSVLYTKAQVLHIVFTSDVHYGITRSHFRTQDNVRSATVNAAEVTAINSLVSQNFPVDAGPEAGKPISYIDAIVITGDLANRQEPPVQPASISWQEFSHDYRNGISTKTRTGLPTTLLLTPGNHDAANAIGSPKPMQPLQDAGSMAGIYSLMMGKQVTTDAYDYSNNRINYSRDISGIHFLFINIWPDSANRIWIEKDLLNVNTKTPVLIFTHDPPQGEMSHFTNPFGEHTINPVDKFENLLSEVWKDSDPKSTEAEQKGLIDLLKKHSNIKAYFHGHSNYTEMYDYTGLHGEITLPVFRADSPMKGRYSGADETKIAFGLISIDPEQHTLTVRECLWNHNYPATAASWGISRTIHL